MPALIALRMAPLVPGRLQELWVCFQTQAAVCWVHTFCGCVSQVASLCFPLPSCWCDSSICFSIPLQGRKEEQLCRGSWSLRPKPQVVGKSQCQFPELGTRNAHMGTHTCTRWPGLCPSETWDDTSRCGMLGHAGCPCYSKSSQWWHPHPLLLADEQMVVTYGKKISGACLSERLPALQGIKIWSSQRNLWTPGSCSQWVCLLTSRTLAYKFPALMHLEGNCEPSFLVAMATGGWSESVQAAVKGHLRLGTYAGGL